MRPHTRGRGERGRSTPSSAWQARFRRRARPPARVRLRRVLPARRRVRSRRSTRTTAVAQHENGIGMARTFEAEVRGRARGRATAATARPALGLLRLGRRRARRGLPRRRERGASTALTRRRPGAPQSTIVTGELRRARCSSRCSRRWPSVARSAVDVLPVANRFFGGNIGVTGLLTGADVAAALAARPPTHRYLLPDVVLSRRPLPRRHDRRRPAPRGRDRPDRRRVARRRAAPMTRTDDRARTRCPSSPSSAGRTSASRRS